MKLTKTQGNENYCCKVVKITEYKKHPQADKLWIVNIDFQNVITGVEPKIGALMAYFPVLSKINLQFLSYINGFSKKELNKDVNEIGFFGDKGRVRPIKLRGLPSEGYLHPVADIESFFIFDSPLREGNEFNKVDDKVLCEKYIVEQQRVKESNTNGNKNKKKVKQKSRLIEGQFALHNDTTNLRKNIHKINPNDLIEISFKKHGTSGVISNILVKKKLRIVDKFLKLLKFPIKDTEYDIIYSSRRVIKNEFENKEQRHYYNENVWLDAANTIKDKIPKGYSFYCEIIGYTKSGSAIQKDYNYGCKVGEFKVFIYKITFTNEDGFVVNLTPHQIKQFCDKYNLNYSETLFYYGYAKDVFTEINSDSETWNEEFLKALEKKFTEKNCFMCINKVPEEGIVLIKEDMFNYEAYKLKSFAFLQKEDKELENNVENIEDNN